jgi:hypothetical protein
MFYPNLLMYTSVMRSNQLLTTEKSHKQTTTYKEHQINLHKPNHKYLHILTNCPDVFTFAKRLKSLPRAISCAAASVWLILRRTDAAVLFTISSDNTNPGSGGGGLHVQKSIFNEHLLLINQNKVTSTWKTDKNLKPLTF